MRERFCYAAVAIFILSAMPATARETWNCTFKIDGGPPNTTGAATIQIDGDKLGWEVQAPALDHNLMPIPLPTGGYQTQTTTFPYRILENNSAKIVAEFVPPKSAVNGMALWGSGLKIDKTDGRLDMGNEGYDGKCLRETTPGPTH